MAITLLIARVSLSLFFVTIGVRTRAEGFLLLVLAHERLSIVGVGMF